MNELRSRSQSTMVTPTGGRAVLWIGTIAVLALLILAVPLTAANPAAGPSGRATVAGSPALAAAAPPVANLPSHHHSYQCDGMLWASKIWASYNPSYCYGHDEPTVSYISTAAGSGGDASFQFNLPADGTNYSQGSFYATFWFGGTVYDTKSTAGGNQGFLEFQFYPAPPTFTGMASGSKDCLPNGAFNPVFTAGSNKWFACAIVWQLTGSIGSPSENAAFAGPLNSGSSSAILVMHSNDHLVLTYSGVAKSATQPWKISVTDTTAGSGGNVSLKNGSLVLSPFYSTAALGNTMLWGASNPGAIAFAYEVGHALDPAIPTSCSPGDGTCLSYWPGLYGKMGQLKLELPVMGAGTSKTYPASVAFSSSQGGSAEVNASSCSSPSFSTSTNCMYPYFEYRGGSYSFTFGASNVANATHTYGSQYQFPSATNFNGQFNSNVKAAPWGTLHATVNPTRASVHFNRAGQTHALVLTAGVADGQFMEGPYWLNVTATGCTASNKFVYISTAKTASIPVNLVCAGGPLSVTASALPTSGTIPLNVSFTGAASGGTMPYTYGWKFGDGGTSTVVSSSHTYRTHGTFVANLTVKDALGNTSSGTVTVTAKNVTLTASCAGKNYTTPFGSVKACSLASGQHTVFFFTLTHTQWSSWFSINVYESDGKVNGTQPVFHMGTGLGGVPSYASATQKSAGPNAKIQISLSVSSANTYGGWGTYWAVVAAPGGSGAFCFEAILSNSALGSGPTCTAQLPHPGVDAGLGATPHPTLRPSSAVAAPFTLASVATTSSRAVLSRVG